MLLTHSLNIVYHVFLEDIRNLVNLEVLHLNNNFIKVFIDKLLFNDYHIVYFFMFFYRLSRREYVSYGN